MATQPEAHELLSSAKAAARAARKARQGYWFPLLVFGVITACAAPFYIEPRVISDGSWSRTGLSLYVESIVPLGTGVGVQIYWTIALVGGYVAVVLFYRLRARRTGVAGRVWPALAVGAGALALLLLTGNWMPAEVGVDRYVPFVFFVRGLVPLVLIGVGIVAFAWVERSIGLLVFGLCFLALAALMNLYDASNLVYRAGWNMSYEYDLLPNLLVPAAMLLVGGAGFLLRARLRRR